MPNNEKERELDEARYGSNMHFLCNTSATTVEEFIRNLGSHLSPGAKVLQRQYFIFGEAYNADGELMPGFSAICCKKEDVIKGLN